MISGGLRDTPAIDLAPGSLSSLLAKERRAYKGITFHLLPTVRLGSTSCVCFKILTAAVKELKRTEKSARIACHLGTRRLCLNVSFVGDEGATVRCGCLPSFMLRGGPAATPEFRKMPRLHDWMSGLKDDRKLVQLCLPGSHDAGVYTDEARKLTPGDMGRCQHENIGKQADWGSRVFDIRCFMDGKTPKMGHFFADKAPLGDWGGTLESALDDAVLFLTSFPSEFLIFRIGHTKCTKEVAEVLKAMDPKTHKMKYANFILKGARGNLADLQVKDLRRRLLLVFGEEFHSDFKVDDGYYPYVKYPNISQNGLSFCGMYSGELKNAAKTFKKDRGNRSPEGAVEIGMKASEGHKTHPPDHLFWVYWQQTGGDVKKNTTDSKGMQGRLGNFLHNFKDPNRKLRLPNVIGHDFVDKFTCGEIVKMNSDLAATLNKYGYGFD